MQEVTVIATDRGVSPRSANWTISVLVVDMNLHRPVFMSPDETAYDVSIGQVPEVRVREQLPLGSVVTQLVAVDEDKGENGKVWFYLIPTGSRDFEYFRLDRLSGQLIVLKTLDREQQEVFEIQVKAEDNGQPTRQAKTMTLRVRLLDIDDNEPSFANVTQPQMLTVQEEQTGAVIGNVIRPSDADSDVNNTRFCFFLYGDESVRLFNINKNTGEISLKGKVDREVTEHLDLVVKAASDCSQAGFSAPSNTVNSPMRDYPGSYFPNDPTLLWIRVSVEDVNDNAPHFVDEFLSAGLITDVDIGSEVISLKSSVTDADLPVNGVHTFRLLTSTAHLEEGQSKNFPAPPFVVTSDGRINTNIRFRSDILGFFVLEIEVYDTSGLRDNTSVKISLVSTLQRVRLVFKKTPNQVEAIRQTFLNELSPILNLDLVIDSIKSHTNDDGTRDPEKTDAYLHGRYQDTGEVVPAAELWSAFDYNQAARDMGVRYGVVDTRGLTEQEPEDDEESLRRVLAIVAIVMGIFIISLVLVLVHLVRMYRRRLRAATTMAFVSTKNQEMYEHPGTNKYYAAENPLFGKEIKQTVADEDRTSQNSMDMNALKNMKDVSKKPEPLGEEQEMVLQISDSPHSTPSPRHHDPNHNAKLEELLKAYDNAAFDSDTEEENKGVKVPQVNGHLKSGSGSYTTGSTSIPGLGEEVQEGLTIFSDTAFPQGPLRYNTSQLEYSDI